MKKYEINHRGKENLKSALIEASIQDIDDIPKDTELNFEFSTKHKKRINRIFREISGIDRIPYPEVDTAFERIRSTIIRKFYKKDTNKPR